MLFTEKTHNGNKLAFIGFENREIASSELQTNNSYKPACFLLPEKTKKDDCTIYVYSLCSAVSLKELFSKRKMSKDFYLYLIDYAINAMEEAKSEGFDIDGLLFEEDKIYFNPKNNSLVLMYLPVKTKSGGAKALKNLLYRLYSQNKVDTSDDNFAKELKELFLGDTLSLTELFKFSYSLINNVKKENLGIKGNSESIYNESDISYEKIKEDDVQFRVVVPQNFDKGSRLPVKVLMYNEDDYERADREAKYVADRINQSLSGIHQAKKGEELRVVLSSPDIEIKDDEKEEKMIWNGKLAQCQFYVEIPENYGKTTVLLKARIYKDIAALCDISVVAQVDYEKEQRLLAMKTELLTAFVSYSHLDHDDVLARIQGMLKANKKLDIFFDEAGLSSGEIWSERLEEEIKKRNIFYLFWSPNAKESEFVGKEIDCALEHRGIEIIEPVPLVNPKICPPPDKLSKIHFNDWILSFINSNKYNKE